MFLYSFGHMRRPIDATHDSFNDFVFLIVGVHPGQRRRLNEIVQEPNILPNYSLESLHFTAKFCIDSKIKYERGYEWRFTFARVFPYRYWAFIRNVCK